MCKCKCFSCQNRICKPKTRCSETCPKGYFTKGQCIDGAKVCYKCSQCSAGNFTETPCTETTDTICAECTKSCVGAGNSANGMVGTCSSGLDVQNAVQCTYSTTPVGQLCAANEWLSMSLSEDNVFTDDVGGPVDTGEAANSLHAFRSDIAPDGSTAVFLGSVSAPLLGTGGRQTVVRVVANLPKFRLASYMFPRDAYFSRLDASGSLRGFPYPTAKFPTWDATDVMIASDKQSLYLFFSWTYDFIGKCMIPASATGQAEALQIQSSSCTFLSTVQFNGTATATNFVLMGCTAASAGNILCAYDAAGTYAVVMVVEEAGGKKTEILGQGYPVLGRPLSPPAFDSSTGNVLMLCHVNSQQVILKMGLLAARNSAVSVYAFTNRIQAFHSLVFVGKRSAQDATGMQLIAANSTSIMSMTGPFFDRIASRDIDMEMRSVKDLAVLPGTSQLYLLMHSRKGWAMYTHCAQCPANSRSPAGTIEKRGMLQVCLCVDNYYGSLIRPVLDVCKACINSGNSSSGSLFRNACPSNMYKTNIQCKDGTSVDTTCGPCTSYCSRGTTEPALNPGEYISALCDGTGTSNSVSCTTCASYCPYDDFYMDPTVVCSGTAQYDERLQTACKPCRGSCATGTYISGRCLVANRPTRDTTQCVTCSACPVNSYIAALCNGSTYTDTKICNQCRYNSTSCSQGSYAIGLCSSGLDLQDRTQCSACNANCKPSNFSSYPAPGYSGQFIRNVCGTTGDNECQTCLSSCGQSSFISEPCSGLTRKNTQCSPCRTRCAVDEYIDGVTCSGITLTDTTSCRKCTNRTSPLAFTLNPCDGTTRQNQGWTISAAICKPGEYIALDATDTQPITCLPCKVQCTAPGFYMQGTCQGNTYADTVTCVPCASCASGKYRSGLSQCNGSNAFDTVTCKDCRYVLVHSSGFAVHLVVSAAHANSGLRPAFTRISKQPGKAWLSRE